MTKKKHFIALAKALKSGEAPRDLCEAIAIVCKQTNPNFDFQRFMAACGHWYAPPPPRHRLCAGNNSYSGDNLSGFGLALPLIPDEPYQLAHGATDMTSPSHYAEPSGQQAAA
jgi:hypothetical protein